MAENPRIEDLRRRVQKDPASIAFAQLAEEYRRAGLYQESVDACTAGLALHPGYLSARVTLGRALIELGEFDRALAELQTVLKTAPENLAAIRGIADIHCKQGRLPEALEFYRTALALARNDPELEQTVTDLAHQVTPTRRAESIDGLSLEQVQRELSARIAPASSAPGGRAGRPESRPADGAAGTGGVTPRKPAPAPPLALRIAHGDAPAPAAADSGQGDRGRALRTLAALEQWLDAIHVSRANGPS